MDFKKLVEAGVHFGHKTSRWHPKMKPFIWGYKNNIHLINVAKTAQQMEKAAQFLESIAAENKTILWVGTKKVAQAPIQEVGKKLNVPYVVHRWVGGTLTNFSQVKKSITKLLHYEDILAKADQSMYTKKEIGMLQKAYDRLVKNVGTIRNFSWPVGAVVIVDVKKEHTALREAKAQGIPVVALVDTNCDPSLIDYVIPCNDDATNAVRIVVEYLANAVEHSMQQAAEAKGKSVEEKTLQAEESIEPLALSEEEIKSRPKKQELKEAKKTEKGRIVRKQKK